MSIQDITKEIRSKMYTLEVDDLTSLLEDKLGDIETEADELDELVKSYEDASCDYSEYFPDGLSVEEDISIRELLSKWRADHGYPAV